ncbi:type II toxin-antitoxin system RelE/ParE family toxin [Solimicrobium silvestre]|uniref:Plasmid stabilization system protein n=1 Tax=Solimicrobium silvestre TaxID=2099400 RepID=A0A2S9GT80_9BURK|nr:type II toxin-antitoxin system RelE/ParE family toxin [Solimicrobium silvestre]PRC90906.1 Plasmid stabilization system protein [Solimicrobium silvestre]
MPTVYTREAARQDLIERYAYLAENASLTIAERFLVNAETSFANLSQQPMLGTPLSLNNLELIGMRKWSVKNFDNILIFYLPRHDGVSIVRVLHGAQQWWELLGVLEK